MTEEIDQNYKLMLNDLIQNILTITSIRNFLFLLKTVQYNSPFGSYLVKNVILLSHIFVLLTWHILIGTAEM